MWWTYQYLVVSHVRKQSSIYSHVTTLLNSTCETKVVPACIRDGATRGIDGRPHGGAEEGTRGTYNELHGATGRATGATGVSGGSNGD
jgi:hypothetical protein